MCPPWGKSLLYAGLRRIKFKSGEDDSAAFMIQAEDDPVFAVRFG